MFNASSYFHSEELNETSHISFSSGLQLWFEADVLQQQITQWTQWGCQYIHHR